MPRGVYVRTEATLLALKRPKSPEHRAKSGVAALKHGYYRTPTYRSWEAMKARCRNPNNDRYGDYGGRGITVYVPWLKFENFVADMGERPVGTTIDRLDNDGPYAPWNCTWSTPKEQANNRRMPVACGCSSKKRRKPGGKR